MLRNRHLSRPMLPWNNLYCMKTCIILYDIYYEAEMSNNPGTILRPCFGTLLPKFVQATELLI